jgi:hypothetical protein
MILTMSLIDFFSCWLPANDNRDLYETPEGALFQTLRRKRRHLSYDLSTMSPERFREWQEVLQGLNEAEQLALEWLHEEP